MPAATPITDYHLTDHARLEMARRQITEEEIDRVSSAPEQVQMVRPGRVVCQSRTEFGELPQVFLVRVFVDVDRRPAEVVTVYRTSKIEKYWRDEL